MYPLEALVAERFDLARLREAVPESPRASGKVVVDLGVGV